MNNTHDAQMATDKNVFKLVKLFNKSVHYIEFQIVRKKNRQTYAVSVSGGTNVQAS